jgi:uncharacterized RDD family membrane protein YckC
MSQTADPGTGIGEARTPASDQPASLLVRLGALGLDILLMLMGLSMVLAAATPVLNLMLGRSAAQTALGALVLLLAGAGMPAYFVAQWAGTRGATLGMRAAGLRVVRAGGGGPLGLGRALARVGGYVLDVVTGVLPGVICAVATPAHRALHDLVSGTAVVRVSHLPDPGTRTWSDRYTDWGVRWRHGLYTRPHRLVAALGIFLLLYLLPLLAAGRRATSGQVASRLVVAALLVGVYLIGWQRYRARGAGHEEIPSPEGSYLAVALLTTAAALSLLAATLAFARHAPASGVVLVYFGLLAALVAAVALWRARALGDHARWLSPPLGERASTFPLLSPLSRGSHRVTVVLADGRRVARVFLIHDRVVVREGRRRRLSFDPATATDVVNEVRT